jgi:Mu transposase-like protein
VGKHAHLLVGALACSGKWRGVLTETEDFGQLVGAIEQVVQRLGGVTQCWRFDRMATVCHPGSGRVTAAFAGVAKYHGVTVKVCPSRHGNRKGVVEKANHSAAQRWWRTVPNDITITAAQAGIDRLAIRMDGRTRFRDGQRLTVSELADHEHLRAAPNHPYPVDVVVKRVVSPQGLVSFDGNQYSVPPGLPGAQVEVATRLGEKTLRVVTAGGATVAIHQRRPGGAGTVVRDEGHVIALERAVLAAFSQARPCNRKARRPASAAATAEAARLRGGYPNASERAAERVVIDLATYAALVPPAAAHSKTPIPKEIP